MPTLHPDHLYKMPRMNRAFALSSIALLLVVVWLSAADYVRDWKRYQAQFNRLDVEKTRTAIDAAASERDAAKLEEVTGQLDAATKEVHAREADLAAAQKDVAREEAAHYRIDQTYRFVKADLDAMKFTVEESRAHHSGEEKVKARFEAMEKNFEEKRQALLAHNEVLDAAHAKVTEITAQRDAAQAGLDALNTAKSRLERKLTKIVPDWRKVLLNLPMADFVAPPLKVKQVVVPDIKNDVNFLQIPRVDRCMTCHVGINQKGFEDAPQPFTTHPRLELFAGDSSKHPMGSFGCTTCHYGHDRGTSFITAAHTPGTAEQQEEWEHKYGWHPLHHWDEPMLPKQHVEAACRKCHAQEVRVPQGARIDKAFAMVERFGCTGCHKISGLDVPKAGPDLRSVAKKLSPDWAMKWIKDPRGFRPSTKMPHFWDLTNTSTPEDLARNNVEADAIIALLWDRSVPRAAWPPPPVHGNATNGERLVNEVGCKGCHQVGPEDPVTDRTALRQFGPELNQIGSKADPGWLFLWLKNPQAMSPTTRMPDLRLTDQEAADIAAYLMTLRNTEFEAKPVPAADPSVRDAVTLEFLGLKLTAEQARTKLQSMSEDEKRLFLGEKFVNRYGCFGCHLIKGFETSPGIGTELTAWASKYIDQLDYGLLQQHETEEETTIDLDGKSWNKVASSKDAWAWQKLKDPRIFDAGRVKKPDEKLKMPNFGFSDEEASTLVTALLSLTKEKVDPKARKMLNADEAAVEAGRRIVTNRNCQGCHILYGEGGEIRQAVEASLVRYEGKTADDAQAVGAIFSPPLLDGEGAKVNPDWFFQFLRQPTTIRPWLKVRMPSFHFPDPDANAIITHFARKDGAMYPFQTYSGEHFGAAEREGALKLFTKDYFNCWTCHQQGSIKPASPIDSWAPDLTLARARLQPDWIVKWLRDPQKLQPGTKMPTFYDPADPKGSTPPDVLDGDPDRQMVALRDYIYSIGQGSRP